MMADEIKKKAVGDRLKGARKKAGLSQAQVCEKAKIPKVQTLSSYETGQNTIPLERLMTLSEIYSVSTDYLLFGKELKRTYTLSDFAQMLDDMNLIMIDFSEQAFSEVDKTTDYTTGYPDCEDVLHTFPAIIIKDETLGKFITDYQKMRELLKDQTITYRLFQDWFNGRLTELEKTSITFDDLPF